MASPEDQRVSWLLGAFYTHERQDVFSNIQSIDEFTGISLAGLPEFLTSAMSASL